MNLGSEMERAHAEMGTSTQIRGSHHTHPDGRTVSAVDLSANFAVTDPEVAAA